MQKNFSSGISFSLSSVVLSTYTAFNGMVIVAVKKLCDFPNQASKRINRKVSCWDLSLLPFTIFFVVAMQLHFYGLEGNVWCVYVYKSNINK